MTRIGLLTSGGDAPGMNAAIRAVVRAAVREGVEVFAIRDGYTGLLRNDIELMNHRSVSNILQHGGTVLGTSRCPAFHNPEARAEAANILLRHGIEGVIAIGGDGTFHGAKLLEDEHGVRIIGIPGTIDNDLYGTDYTIGFDTAINTALDAIDRIRDTAHSLERIHFVEVMGREAGFIALEVGLAGGAEEIVVPEMPTDLEAIRDNIRRGQEMGKRAFIIVVAEGGSSGGAFALSKRLSAMVNMEPRVTVLGHIQRGGKPSARDRVLASRLGVAAVNAFLDGQSGVMVGEIGRQIVYTPLEDTWVRVKAAPIEDMRLSGLLST